MRTEILALSLALSVPSSTWAEPIKPAAPPNPAVDTKSGDWIAKHIGIELAPLPTGWRSETQVMDDIWRPLGLRGTNYYAYGGAEKAKAYASRSDPASPLYQAWFGVYVVDGDKTAEIGTGLKLGALDQASWLQSMGDAHPVGFAQATYEKRGTLRIGGGGRTLYYIRGRSHSDLSSAATGLAKHVGMPPQSYWSDKVTPFHDLQLRGYMSLWHDARRNVTFVVYAVAPLFRTTDGKVHDDFAGLDTQFQQMMQKVHIVEN